MSIVLPPGEAGTLGRRQAWDPVPSAFHPARNFRVHRSGLHPQGRGGGPGPGILHLRGGHGAHIFQQGSWVGAEGSGVNVQRLMLNTQWLLGLHVEFTWLNLIILSGFISDGPSPFCSLCDCGKARGSLSTWAAFCSFHQRVLSAPLRLGEAHTTCRFLLQVEHSPLLFPWWLPTILRT